MEDRKPGYYAVIPASVRYDQSLPSTAKLLYGEISSLVNENGFCFATNQYFSDLYGCSQETVARLITKLVTAGHICRLLDKDANGQVKQRRLYLTVSLPHVQPLDKNDTTPLQKCQEGGDENVKENITSIDNIEKENKKEKVHRTRRKPLNETQMTAQFITWISQVGGLWNRDTKNAMYLALVGFYAPRDEKRKEPARTEQALTALCNRLLRHSAGDPAAMLDMLDRATCAGWKSVYPSGQNNAPSGDSGSGWADDPEVI